MYGTDKDTVKQYIDLLEKLFIIFRLNALSPNVKESNKKGKEINFFDNEIRNVLIGIFQSFENRTDNESL